MTSDAQSQTRFIGEVINLVTGTIFVAIGMMVLLVTVVRRHATGMLAVFWLGVWSALYGIQRLNDCSFMVALLPHWMQVSVNYSHALCTYLVLVVGLLTFRELTLGKLRNVVTFLALSALLIAVLGIARFFLTGDEYTFVKQNSLVATVGLVILLVFFSIPRLSQQNVLIGNRGVVLAGTIVFGFEGLLTNAVRPFGYNINSIWGDLGFFVFLLSLGYAAMQQVDANERRLSSIESELAVARQLQFSILPAATPEVRNLRIAAAYEPMTAVAGDFYEFLPIDDHRAGFLIADVSGHGVPAALIASMIKVAAQSLFAYASDPSEVLLRLRNILSVQLQSQFVSAAYLWIDSETRTARYSAAGHPPLLCWRAANGALERIQSNGLLLGVPFDSARCPCAFPARDIPFATGDRFLLYTDGFSEPENAIGEAFGDRRLEQILRENSSRPAAELSLLLLSDVRAWQPASTTQQDDITFLIIDVL